MFAAFIRPARPLLIITFVLLAILAPWGRFVAFDGAAWTLLALGVTVGVFAVAAAQWPALRQLDVPAARWRTSAAATATVWSIALASLITLAMTLMQQRSAYYAGYDFFLVTAGDAHVVDTNGEPYVLENLGQSPATIALSWALVALSLVAATVIGLAIGLSLNWLWAVGATVAALLVLLVVAVVAPALHPLTLSVALTIPVGLSLWVIRKTTMAATPVGETATASKR